MNNTIPKPVVIADSATNPRDLTAGSQPNVVFISIDDLNDWVGVLQGYVDVQTPNIDRLAAQGLTFKNAHTPVPVCNPARTAALTGLQPDTTGIFDNGQDWREVVADGETIPEYFSQHGYESVGSGKLFHINKPSAFDQYFNASGPRLNNAEKGRFGAAALDVPLEEYGDVQVADFAIDYLEQTNADDPFFLGVGFSRPHSPLAAPKEFFDLYPLESIELPNLEAADDLDDVPLVGQQIAGKLHQSILKKGDWATTVQAYLANITFADAQVGRVLDAIENNGLADNTVIALWSDHGWHLGEKLHWQKRSLWEEATRVPLIVSAPGVTEAGSETNAAVSLVDLFPTLIDLTGVPDKENLEGRSLSPLLENPDAQWEHAVVSTWDKSYAIRTERWRYIRYWDDTEELYDHQSDADEFTNLANDPAFQAVKAELSAELDDYFAEYAPERLPAPNENQVLTGTELGEVFTGGAGDDTLSGLGGDDTLFGREGQNELSGGDGNDFLSHASRQSGMLFGNSGEDTLVGGEGNDTLDGGLGADVLEGRGGKDLYLINHEGDRILESPDNQGDEVHSSVDWKLRAGFFRLKLSGSAMTGRGNLDSNRIIGNRRDNQLFGEAGNDFLSGGEGNDLLTGGLGNDRLLGGLGNDTLNGGGGDDVVKIVVDSDILLTDDILEGEGKDILFSIEAAELVGGASANKINASSFTQGPVKIRGLNGDDELHGGRGNDELIGGSGVDTVVVRARRRRLKLTNTSVIGDGEDQLRTIERATLFGHGGDSIIDASSFSGFVYMNGRDGNDTLIPSMGDSRLVGAAGADTFTLNRRQGGNVHLRDFNADQGDVIAIEADILGPQFTAGQGISPNQLIVGVSAENQSHRFIFNPNDEFLWFDMDGLGGKNATRLVKIKNVSHLDVGSLSLI